MTGGVASVVNNFNRGLSHNTKRRHPFITADGHAKRHTSVNLHESTMFMTANVDVVFISRWLCRREQNII